MLRLLRPENEKSVDLNGASYCPYKKNVIQIVEEGCWIWFCPTGFDPEE